MIPLPPFVANRIRRREFRDRRREVRELSRKGLRWRGTPYEEYEVARREYGKDITASPPLSTPHPAEWQMVSAQVTAGLFLAPNHSVDTRRRRETLSGRVQFPREFSRAGMFVGTDIAIPLVVTNSIRTSASSRFDVVSNGMLHYVSESGWQGWCPLSLSSNLQQLLYLFSVDAVTIIIDDRASLLIINHIISSSCLSWVCIIPSSCLS